MSIFSLATFSGATLKAPPPPPRPAANAAQSAAAGALILVVVLIAAAIAVATAAIPAPCCRHRLCQDRHRRKGVGELDCERLIGVVLDEQLPFARVLGDVLHFDVAAFHRIEQIDGGLSAVALSGSSSAAVIARLIRPICRAG